MEFAAHLPDSDDLLSNIALGTTTSRNRQSSSVRGSTGAFGAPLAHRGFAASVAAVILNLSPVPLRYAV